MWHFVTPAMSLLRKKMFISMDNCKHSGKRVVVNHFAILPNAPSEFQISAHLIFLALLFRLNYFVWRGCLLLDSLFSVVARSSSLRGFLKRTISKVWKFLEKVSSRVSFRLFSFWIILRKSLMLKFQLSEVVSAESRKFI